MLEQRKISLKFPKLFIFHRLYEKHLLFILFLLIPFLSVSQSCDSSFTFTQRTELPSCQKTNGKVYITNVSGGSAPYIFQLNNETNNTGTFSGLDLGEYTLKITDANNCVDDTAIVLNHVQEKQFFRAPNAFSPNNDGINDTWKIGGVDKVRGVHVSIYNKWGQELVSVPDYTNLYAWDGTQSGNKLPEGTYYYIITALIKCREVNKNGTVTIIR